MKRKNANDLANQPKKRLRRAKKKLQTMKMRKKKKKEVWRKEKKEVGGEEKKKVGGKEKKMRKKKKLKRVHFLQPLKTQVVGVTGCRNGIWARRHGESFFCKRIHSIL